MDEWDDELSELPVDRRRIRLRRGAYLTVCAGLVTLIILTVVFVGNDTKSVATVAANGTTSTSGPSTTGFATSLPVGVTATSLSDPSSTSSTSSTTTTTLKGIVVLPQQTTTTSSTTTTTLPPFQFTPAGSVKTSQLPTGVKFISGDAASCPIPSDVQATFSTSPPGTIQINPGFAPPVSGPVSPGGNFDLTDSNGGHYVGTVSQVDVKTNYTVGSCSPTTTYAITWTFK